MQIYIAFLRGVNVGGHHKLSMAELKQEMEKLNFKNIETILNTGNIIFSTNCKEIEILEKKIINHLAKTFGFHITTVVKTSKTFNNLIEFSPFKELEITKNIQLYATFLPKDIDSELSLPWSNEDKSYTILAKYNNTLFSIVDISKTKTTKGMNILEKYYGKNNTTRNWNTIKRIEKKLRANSFV